MNQPAPRTPPGDEPQPPVDEELEEAAEERSWAAPTEPAEEADEDDGDATSIRMPLVSRRLVDPAELDPGAEVVAAWGDDPKPLVTKVVPLLPSEFVCSRCRLAKHRSQLVDRRRLICRDCL